MSIAEIVSNSNSNVSFYNSLQNKNSYYEKCFQHILLTSLVIEKIEETIDIDNEILYIYENIKSIEQPILSLQEWLNTPSTSSIYVFKMKFLSLKLNREEKRNLIQRIHYLNQYKNECFQEIQEENKIQPITFSLEVNKLRDILGEKNRQQWLIPTRNKKKNYREINKLLFGKEEKGSKYNKIRKTKCPNNKLYY